MDNPKYIVGYYVIQDGFGYPIGPSWIYMDNNIEKIKDFCKKYLKSKDSTKAILNVFTLAKSTDKRSKYNEQFQGKRYKPYGTMTLISKEGLKKYMWLCSTSKNVITHYRYK